MQLINKSEILGHHYGMAYPLASITLIDKMNQKILMTYVNCSGSYNVIMSPMMLGKYVSTH